MKTNTLIYTEERIREILEAMKIMLQEDNDIIFIGQLTSKLGFSYQRISERNNNNKDIDNWITDTIKEIKEILETRALVWSMSWKLNATMTIFHLKNNYWYKDKTEVENTHTMKAQDFEKLNQDQILALANGESIG